MIIQKAKMVKACHLSSVHPALDTRIFHKEAKTLARAGYEVALIAQHDKNEILEGVRIIALPKPENRLRRMMGTWGIYSSALKQKADIYHLHDPELLPVGLLLKFLNKAKVVYDVHEDYPKAIQSKGWLPSFIRKPLSYAFDFFEKWAALRLDYIIAVTDNIAKKFRKAKIATIKNYPILENIQAKSEYDFKSPALIYAGGLSKERGISEIVQAMAYLDSSRNARLVLYGKFKPENYQEDYQEIIQRLKVTDRVEYRGWIKTEQMWQKMREATIGITCLHPEPNHINALPTKLFEYMAAGLPAIVSNFPLLKEIITGNSCGLTVNPLDPEEIARAVEYLIGHPDEARRMGENGRKAVMEKYNWENEGKKLLALYEELFKPT